MASCELDVDGLVGSFSSVCAGDRGHAIRDLRDTLFASLSHVALGPSVQPDEHSSSGHASPNLLFTGLAGRSPSPPPGLASSFRQSPALDNFTPLPASALSPSRRTPPKGRSRSGSHGQRQPPPSPVRSTARGAPRRARARAEPYSGSRPRGLSNHSGAGSWTSTRHTSPEHDAVSAALVNAPPSSTSHSSQSPSSYVQGCPRSTSSTSTTSAPPRTSTSPRPGSLELGFGAGLTTSTNGPGRKCNTPSWGAILSFTPMHQDDGSTFASPSTCSVLSSEGLPASTSTSASASAFNLAPLSGDSQSPSKGCPDLLHPPVAHGSAPLSQP